VPRAATVNAAISLRARATVTPASRYRVVNQQRGLELASGSPEAFFGHPFAALAGRLLEFFGPPSPLEIRFETSAPPGSGLGGSSSLGMAIAGALNEATGAGWTIRQLVRIVMDTEVRILRTATGSQDQFAAGLGGTRVHHWVSPEPRSESLPWLDDGADPLDHRFVLVYTGEAHSSADPNGSVLERVFAGEPSTVRGIEVIAEAAYGMRAALLARDWNRTSEMLDLEWSARRALSPRVTTPTIERLGNAMRQAGARAVKACGAGGGGTMIAIAPPEKRAAVAAAATAAGGAVLQARSDAEGLRREPS
jgi:D-glycero-alpha-D-manno-heptose-7-phosphate kinase